MRFSGSLVPLITPFDPFGKIDKKALFNLVEWHISSGTDGIICCATTGEGPVLTGREKKRVAEICIQASCGRIPILVATGTCSTRESVQNTEIAKQIGANGCLVITPYYNKPTQKGCILHFQEIAKVGLPVIVYHNPSRAGIRLNKETIFELAQIPHIVGIKESSHDLKLVREICRQIPVFSGEDDLSFEIMKEGGIGSIATSANLIPKEWKQMILDCLEGRWTQANFLFQKYLPLCHTLFLETNPQGVKFALSCLGKCKEALRLPLIQVTDQTKEEIQKELLRLAVLTKN